MPDSVSCPRCGAAIERGALRCWACGADARGAVDEGLTLEIDDATAEALAVSLEVGERLQEIAPAVLRWLRLPPARRGPRPDVHPRHRAEVEELLNRLR